MAIKLSKTTKLDGIKSWSLQAWDTCPGARVYKTEAAVPACDGCYARGGKYHFKDVKAIREHNREDWQRDEWEADMIDALSCETYFRWLDSGDLYSVDLAWKVYTVMCLTPHVQHWLPTRMYKFAKFTEVLDAMRALPNVSVRFSSDSVSGEFTPGVHGSTIVADRSQLRPGVALCGAYTRGGVCDGCRACWEDKGTVIAYLAHGQRMRRTIKIMQAKA
jgi:hypothetical protein